MTSRPHQNTPAPAAAGKPTGRRNRQQDPGEQGGYRRGHHEDRSRPTWSTPLSAPTGQTGQVDRLVTTVTRGGDQPGGRLVTMTSAVTDPLTSHHILTRLTDLFDQPDHTGDLAGHDAGQRDRLFDQRDQADHSGDRLFDQADQPAGQPGQPAGQRERSGSEHVDQFPSSSELALLLRGEPVEVRRLVAKLAAGGELTAHRGRAAGGLALHPRGGGCAGPGPDRAGQSAGERFRRGSGGAGFCAWWRTRSRFSRRR